MGAVELELEKLSPDETRILDECAILAMKDHGLQENNCRGLRLVRIEKAIRDRVEVAHLYWLTFQAESGEYGLRTYEAGVWDSEVHRSVQRVRTITPTIRKWYNGNLCIPLM